MIYASKYNNGHGSQPTALGISVSAVYWVLDTQGRLADSASVETLPGASLTDSPYSIGIETPLCDSCSELREVLCDRLRTAQLAAAEQDCRLVAVGVRPDQLADSHDDPPETAGVTVRFETHPQQLHTVYNVLLALDPAFVLLGSADADTGSQRRAALTGGARRVEPYWFTGVPAEPHGITLRAADATALDTDSRWRPVRITDETTVEWYSLDSSTPTLLVDLLADVMAILQEATDCRVEIGTFGNGFEVGCLQLPTASWRQQYLDDAVTNGASSLRLRAYLERLGFETGWYRLAQPPSVQSASALGPSTVCQRRADLLAADVGCSALFGSN